MNAEGKIGSDLAHHFAVDSRGVARDRLDKSILVELRLVWGGQRLRPAEEVDPSEALVAVIDERLQDLIDLPGDREPSFGAVAGVRSLVLQDARLGDRILNCEEGAVGGIEVRDRDLDVLLVLLAGAEPLPVAHRDVGAHGIVGGIADGSTVGQALLEPEDPLLRFDHGLGDRVVNRLSGDAERHRALLRVSLTRRRAQLRDRLAAAAS